MVNKALFLDRDGIINIDHGYVYQQADFEFIPGIFEVCFIAQSLGYLIIIVTNQSGIGRGLYTENDFKTLMAWVSDEFKRHHINIDDIYFCPHHPTEAKGDYLGKCECRKPQPGMLLAAQKKHHINMGMSTLIGDSKRDITAGEAAGVGTTILHPKNTRFNAEWIKAWLTDLASQAE